MTAPAPRSPVAAAAGSQPPPAGQRTPGARPERPVAIAEAVLVAHGLTRSDLAAAYAGTTIILPDGSAWRVTGTGGLDAVAQGASPAGRSIAVDPNARRTS